MEVKLNFSKQEKRYEYEIPFINKTCNAFNANKITTTNSNSNHKIVDNSISQGNKNKNISINANESYCALKELDALIGLHEVKLLIKELKAYVLVQKARAKEKLTNDPMVLHMVFKGKAMNVPGK